MDNRQILAVFLAASLGMPIAAHADEAAKGARKEKAQAYKAQQQTENKAFRQSLKDVPEGQREAAIVAHRNSQFEENLAAHAKMHDQQMAQLRSKLADNKNLTDAQKQEIIAKAEQEYQNNVAQAKARHAETMSYAQQVRNDPNLSPNQKKEKMQQYHQQNKAEYQAARQDKKAKRENLREEFKKRKQTTMPTTETK